MLTELGIVVASSGVIGAVGSECVVSQKLNTARLSMNLYKGKTKEHCDGLSLKWPWFRIQEPEIKLNAEIIITSGGILLMDWDQFVSEKVYEKISPRVYEVEGQIPIYGAWATAIQPLKGNLWNFVNKTPQVGALMTMARIDLNISDSIAGKPVEDILKEKQEISNRLARTFGGETETTEFEKSYGIRIFDPQLFDLNMGKRSQEASEKLFEAQKFKQSMVELADQIEDPDKRANAIFIANKLITKNVYDVEGLPSIVKAFTDRFFSGGK